MARWVSHLLSQASQAHSDMTWAVGVGGGGGFTAHRVGLPLCLEHGSGEIRAFRKGEKGDVAEGDWLCFLSGNRPVWFAVRESEFGERAKKRVLESEIGLVESLGGGFEFDDGVDIEALDIDPVTGVSSLSSWFLRDG